MEMVKRHNLPLPSESSGQVHAGYQQPIEHPLLCLVAPHSSCAHLHSANGLLGAVVGPREAWIVEGGGVALPVLTEADQQVAQPL